MPFPLSIHFSALPLSVGRPVRGAAAILFDLRSSADALQEIARVMKKGAAFEARWMGTLVAASSLMDVGCADHRGGPQFPRFGRLPDTSHRNQQPEHRWSVAHGAARYRLVQKECGVRLHCLFASLTLTRTGRRSMAPMGGNTHGKPLVNPHDHSELERIYTEMHAARWINVEVLSLLSSMLVLHFVDVRCALQFLSSHGPHLCAQVARAGAHSFPSARASEAL